MPISLSKTTTDLTLFGESDKGILNEGDRNQIRRVVADKLLEMVFEDMESQKSSVTGRSWKGLTSKYKDIKTKKGGSNRADLFLSGKLRNSYKSNKTVDGIEFGVFASSQAPKSHGHITGGGNLPKRQSIPNTGESFRSGIRNALASEIRKEGKRIIDKKLTKKVKELNTIVARLK